MLDKHSLVSIFDADTLVYLVAYRAKDEEDTDKVLTNVDTFVQTILTNTSCTHYIGFLGGSKETFRNQISSTYKANRPESPEWYKKWGGIIKAYLRDKWKFIVVNNIEADDAVSIAAHELRFLKINHVIVGADKDLLQIEGNHYNLRTHRKSYIDELTAYKNKYTQILMGDNADNITGCRGIAKIKANRLLQHLSNFEDIEEQVILTFQKVYGKEEGILKYIESEDLCTLLWSALPYTHLELEYIEVPRIDIPGSLDSIDEVIADIWG